MQKIEVDLIRGKKEILLLSSFVFIRNQVVVRSMDHLLKLWYESPEAATRITMHTGLTKRTSLVLLYSLM